MKRPRPRTRSEIPSSIHARELVWLDEIRRGHSIKEIARREGLGCRRIRRCVPARVDCETNPVYVSPGVGTRSARHGTLATAALSHSRALEEWSTIPTARQDDLNPLVPTRSVCSAIAVPASLRARSGHSCGIRLSRWPVWASAQTCERHHPALFSPARSQPTASSQTLSASPTGLRARWACGLMVLGTTKCLHETWDGRFSSASRSPWSLRRAKWPAGRIGLPIATSL